MLFIEISLTLACVPAQDLPVLLSPGRDQASVGTDGCLLAHAGTRLTEVVVQLQSRQVGDGHGGLVFVYIADPGRETFTNLIKNV